MTISNEERFEFVGSVGVEAWQHIGGRMRELGLSSSTHTVIAELGAVAVCLANVLRPAIEASNSPSAAADRLLERVVQQAQMLLDPVIGHDDTAK